MANLLDCKDEQWLAAEAMLEAARRMPAGSERIEALKRAGILRWLACERLFERDDDHVL